MATSKKLSNIESIIKEIKKSSDLLIKIIKLDGITAECWLPVDLPAAKGIKEVNKICKDLKLLPVSTEENEEKSNVFALQFPELDVQYTEKQIEKMYKDTYTWLLEGLLEKDKENVITKELLLQYKDVFTKQAITIYCKSNINPYKTPTIEYLNNLEYRNKLDKIYYSFIEDYLVKKEI